MSGERETCSDERPELLLQKCNVILLANVALPSTRPAHIS